jgi:3-oxoacyl-[acyl-carrier protein] reductase
MSKYALVTGSSRGIGRAIAIQLANDGYDVFVQYRSEIEKAQEVLTAIEEAGQRGFLLQADVTIDTDLEKMFSALAETTSSLNVLVNNVGFDYGYLFEDYSTEQIRYLIDVNLTQKMMVTKYALPFLKESSPASIVNLSSRMGKEKTIKTISAYGPPEAGVIKFTQCCALEFAPYRIRVNCVAPGLTKTDLPMGILTDEDWDAAAENNPSGRVGEPQDIANLVSFLVSDRASYINGETIGINGGSNLG